MTILLPIRCHCGHVSRSHRTRTGQDTGITWHCATGCLCLGFGSGEYAAPAQLVSVIRRPTSQSEARAA